MGAKVTLGGHQAARGWVAECQKPAAEWLPRGDCRTVGLHPKDILTTPPPLGPEQAPFRPALTREPGEIPSQSPGLSKPCLMTKEVKATNTQQTFAWVCHEGPDAIQEFALTEAETGWGARVTAGKPPAH